MMLTKWKCPNCGLEQLELPEPHTFEILTIRCLVCHWNQIYSAYPQQKASP